MKAIAQTGALVGGRRWLAAALAAASLTPARPYYGPEVVGGLGRPPPPREEFIGVAPWLPGIYGSAGYWGWTAGGTNGSGPLEAPREGYRWVPHEGVREESGWSLHPGHWERH